MGSKPKHSNEDGAWKAAISQYSKEFLEFFFPETAELIDFDQPTGFLDKEFVRTPSIKGMTADMLLEVRKKQTGEKMLLHVEVQGRGEKDFEKRMAKYALRIFLERGELPTTLILLTDTNPDFQVGGFEKSGHRTLLRLDFCQAKLIEYEKPLHELDGSSALFAVFTAVQAAAGRLRSTRAGKEKRYEVKKQLLLGLCGVGRSRGENASLLRFLDSVVNLLDSQERRLKRELWEMEDVMGFADLVEQDGIQKGTLAASQAMLIRLMKRKFSLQDAQLFGIRKVKDSEKLQRAIELMMFAQSPDEIFKELQ